MANYLKTATNLLSTVDTIASAVSSTATLANDYIELQVQKQRNLNEIELKQGNYLSIARAEQLTELSELLAGLPEDIAKQIVAEAEARQQA